LFPDDNTHAMKTALSGRLMHGMEDLLKKRGLSLIVTSMPTSNSLPACIENRQVDGVILRGTNRANHISLLENAAGKAPVVYIFEPQTRVPGHWDVVCEDNDAIATAAFDYFKARHRTRLAVINPSVSHPSLTHRAKVFAELAKKQMGGCRLMQEDKSVESMLEELFSTRQGSSNQPDGLFVPGIDDVVGCVFKWLASRGLLHSKDLDVMACQDDPHRFSLIRQQNDYIDTNAEAIGRAAVETFLWRLQNPKEPQRKLAIEPVLVTADVGSLV
jgi:DNA-binding LacI/PurR family transcriptional regulator